MSTKYMNYGINNRSLNRNIGPILEEWIGIIDSYTRYDRSDALYYYNERATLSTFTGAIWKNDGFALEEFMSQKTKIRQNMIGVRERVDLWFLAGNQHFIIEAKQQSLSISELARKTSEIIERKIESSCDEVRKSKKEYLDAFLCGLYFAPLHLPASIDDKKLIQERIEYFIDIAGKIKCDFYAYCFPLDGNAKVLYEAPNGSNKLYHGVAAFGRLIK